MEDLLSRNRRSLSNYTADWIRAFPQSATAWHARAQQLERLGVLSGDSSESARFAITRARALASEGVAAAEMAVDEARILLRQGNAPVLKRLVDSLTQTDVTSPDIARVLAPIAALSGDARLLRSMLLRAAPTWSFRTLRGEPMLVSRPVANAALELYAYALLGRSPDSLALLENALAEAVGAWSTANRRAQDLESLRHVPALLGFPVFGIRAAHRSPLAPQELVRQRQLVEGDPETRRSLLEIASRFMSAPTSEVSPETAYLAGHTLMFAGDTVAGRRLLARTLGNLAGLPMTVLLTPQGPAALRRTASLFPESADTTVAATRRLLETIGRFE
jgi:hypothetical protein